jgi:uncharacterized membrane protein (Fun14 family)
MPSRFRYVGLAILAALILGPLLGYVFGLAGAVIVMILIAVIGFSTVVLVMMFGLIEVERPHAAEESDAVQAWSKRLNAQSDEQTSQAEASEDGES